MEELQTDKVESGVTLDQATAVPRVPVPRENGKIDPVESGMQARAPDDIGDCEGSTVFEQRQAITHTGDTRYTLHAAHCEIAGLDANQWAGLVQQARPDLAANCSLDRQQAVEDEAEDERL